MIWIRQRIESLRPEGGAFAVLFSICCVAFFSIVALVIDLAAMRSDQQTSQSVTDSAALAGAAYLDSNFGGTAAGACAAAWGYFKTNAPGVSASEPSPCAPVESGQKPKWKSSPAAFLPARAE